MRKVAVKGQNCEILAKDDLEILGSVTKKEKVLVFVVHRVIMGKKRPKKILESYDEKSPQKIWRCLICSTEDKLKTFDSDKDLLFHHMSHSILELAQALNEIQNFLKTSNLLHLVYLTKQDKISIEEGEIKIETSVDLDDDLPINEEQGVRNQESSSVKSEEKSKKYHECPMCGKILSSKGNLNKHMIIHDPSKKFECSDCPAKFNQVNYNFF